MMKMNGLTKEAIVCALSVAQAVMMSKVAVRVRIECITSLTLDVKVEWRYLRRKKVKKSKTAKKTSSNMKVILVGIRGNSQLGQCAVSQSYSSLFLSS